ERGARLGHLQQRQQRLLHACTARRREADQPAALIDAAIDRAAEALADHRAHRAAEKLKLERTGDQRLAVQRTGQRDQRIALAGHLLRLRQAVTIAFTVLESERILRPDALADLA